MVKERLIFAGLCRVSSESQVKENDFTNSLKEQRAEIERSVKRAGGNPKEIVWDFSGMEHTFNEQLESERKLLTALLEEVENEPRFNAVMVDKLDRLGRDMESVMRFHGTLIRNGIDFYERDRCLDIGSRTSDLRTVGHAAVESEAWAMDMLDRSMRARYERARSMGKCTAGAWVGRRWDKEAGCYVVDRELKAKVNYAVKELHGGASMYDVAQHLKMQREWLYKVLKKAGPTHTFKLGCRKKLRKIYPLETEFTITGPALCDDLDMWKEVMKTIEHNKGKFRTSHKRKAPQEDGTFPLRGFVRCGHCHYAMPPYVQRRRNKPEDELQRARRNGVGPVTLFRMYRHNQFQNPGQGCYVRGIKCDHPWPQYVNAEKLERAVTMALFKEVLSEEHWQKAKAALEKQNGHAAEELKLEIEKTKAQMGKALAEEDTLLKMAKAGAGGVEKLAAQLRAADAEAKRLKAKAEELEGQLEMLPTAEELARKVESVKGKILSVEEEFEESVLRRFRKLPPDKRGMVVANNPRVMRKLFQDLFGSNPMYGVFVKKHADGSFMIEVRSAAPALKFKL
jgi:DNA invertase Pin-like site-specific DNA recombinase